MPEETEEPLRIVNGATNSVLGEMQDSMRTYIGSMSFGSPKKNSENCPICGKVVGSTQPHIYMEHNDGKRRYKMYSCRVHSGKCYKMHLLTEQALMVIRKHLWDNHKIVANEDQIYEIIHKIELAKHIMKGKTIEWQWEMKYIAQIYDTSPEGAKSFVENDLTNQVNYVDITWTPVWQLVE